MAKPYVLRGVLRGYRVESREEPVIVGGSCQREPADHVEHAARTAGEAAEWLWNNSGVSDG